MKLTKDEARILAVTMEITKYQIKYPSGFNIFESLQALEDKLRLYTKDSSYAGITNLNDWNDLLKRYAKSNKNK